MTFAAQWRELRAGLPEGWGAANLVATVSEEEHGDRAALILAAFGPGRAGATFRLTARPSRDPERILARLDEAGIRGRLDLADTAVEPERPAAPPAREPAERAPALAQQWDELAATLPADWSDLYAELDLDSSDFLERGALLLSPLNPARYGGSLTLRFRCARTKGYGTAPGMTRRCLERLDGERITGRLRPLRVLAETSLAATQGPVWRIEGRSV